MTSTVLAGLLMRMVLLPPEVIGAKGKGSATKRSAAASNFSKLEKLDTRINRIDFYRFRDPYPEGNLVPVGGYNALDSNTLLDQMYMRVEQGRGTGDGNFKSSQLLEELSESGVKYNPDDVLTVTKTSNGKVVWLEKGNSKSGFEHVMI